MLIDFFYHLRAHKLPVSVNEYLTLVNALRHDLMPPTLDDFYFLARATLVKDESLYDRYDRPSARTTRASRPRCPKAARCRRIG